MNALATFAVLLALFMGGVALHLSILFIGDRDKRWGQIARLVAIGVILFAVWGIVHLGDLR